MKPLADEMNKVAAGFQSFPKQMRDFLSESERVGRGTNKTARAFGGFKLRLGLSLVALRQLYHKMGDWVQESNAYVENLNLFRITMRDTSDEALAFAERVHDAFGIDPSEWMRFQAVFQNMATGFGIASDKAAIMSKNLTQLGYDLATVFNVNYEVAMQKLQSAIAGQPRPMREWGFDMSESTLKLVALNNGIKQNVETMTQYEKSQLRYIQLMQTAEKQGILGNFAREIHTPANAFRILNQQLVQFKRALGNMVIPILMKILPYLQAFVVVLTDIARALANLLGFTLPIIDYSGIGDNFGAIGDEADEANDSVSKLKNSLMGFDELNILSRSSGTGGIGGIGSGFEIDPSLYDYDFLGEMRNQVNDLVDAFYEKIQPVIQYIKDNFNHIKDVVIAIGIGMLGWKITKGIASVFDVLKSLPTGGAGITLGITMTIAGIVLGTSGIANLVSGSDDLWDVLKAVVGGALGLGGALLAFGTGPLGWTIGIGAVLTMTISGFIIGTNKSIDALIQEAISGNGGTLITDLSNAFSNVMEEIVRGYEPIIEGGEKLKATSDAVEKAKNGFLVAFDALSAGSGTAEENIASITDSLTALIDATQNLRKTAYNNITYALSTSLKDTAKAMGVDVANILLELDKLKSDTDRTMEDYKKRLEEINEQYRLSGDIQEYTKAVAALGDQFGVSNPVLEEVDFNFRTMMTTLKGIDWESETDRAKALENIGKSSAKARDAVDEAFDGIVESLGEYRKLATDPKAKVALDELLGVTTRAREEAYGRINDNLGLLFGEMEKDLVLRIASVAQEASDQWNEMTPVRRFFAGSEAKYVAEAIMRFKNDTMGPISEEMIKAFLELGFEGSDAMIEAVDNIMKEGFDYNINGAGMYVAGFGEDLTDLILEEIKKTEARANENPLEVEITSGIDSTLDDVSKKVKNFKLPRITVDISANTSALIAMQKGTRMAGYSDGGFPPEGQIFMARENGPELVGNIGGRTAVVNNDQIVESVSAGVAKAVSSVIGRSSGESGDIVIQVNEMELGRISKSAINKYNKVTGNMALEL
jgi:tetratricopeptide (TPR) repeat protein